ncbi:MAG: thiamine diphosphokinase [Pelotomaculum sp.]|nr:thiamine diphosphokinase [Pelotomaculum sp.]
MRFLIMANGDYGDIDWYRRQVGRFDRIICVDGGAGRAKKMGIVPDWIVGDMDSIAGADRRHMEEAGACFKVFPPEKDFTDTQLALELAEKEGAGEIVVWGGTGSRLDHTLSNLCSASSFALKGIKVIFDSPALTIHLVKDRLVLPGDLGDTVSLIVLGDRATGVSLKGFRYPLEGATLEGNWQWAVSNVITGADPVIQVSSGVLAVFHYKECVP